MRNTYQNRHGTFYIRLKVPKVLLPHVSRPHVIHSLRTKDHRQAYLLSMKASLAFEEWVRDMKNKFGIGDDNRVLVEIDQSKNLYIDRNIAAALFGALLYADAMLQKESEIWKKKR